MNNQDSVLEAPFLLDELMKNSPLEEQALKGIPIYKKGYFTGADNNIEPFATGVQISRSISVSKHIRFQDMPTHRHEFVEMCYACSGEVIHEINGHEVRMHPGDILLLNKYTPHSVRCCGETDIAVNFHILPQFFDETYELAAKSNILSDFIVDVLRGSVHSNQYLMYATRMHMPLHHLLEILLCTVFSHPDEICPSTEMIPGSIAQSIMFLVIFYLSHDLSDLDEQGSLTYEQIMHRTIDTYIDESYPTATLRELAGLLCQTESGLSRQIHSMFGVTFKELLQSKRFNRAITILRETNLPVSDIALMVGYENSSYFYRRFREIHHMSPGEFREQCRRK